MTRVAKPSTSSGSHTEAACHRNDGDDAEERVCAVPEPGISELPLTLAEQILLVVGLNIANAPIAFVEPPLTSRSRGETPRCKAAHRCDLPDGEWP